MRDRILLRQLQHLPLSAKITMAEQRIREWYEYWNGQVYVSVSGGKDSTVLAHLVHGMYPDVPLVFANTGLEYPEIRRFAESMGAEVISPKMRFDQVISKYGYPLISKEVSEAIYYARKIVDRNPQSLENQPGGGYTALREEQDGTARRERRYGAHRKTYRGGGTAKIPQGATEWRRANLTNTIPDTRNPQCQEARRVPRKSKGGYSGRDLRRIERFRKQLLGK